MDQPKRVLKKVRVRFLSKCIEQEIPPVLRLLLQHYITYTQERKLSSLSYVVDGPLPQSLNHNKGRRLGISKSGKPYSIDFLKPEVEDFRKATLAAMGNKRFNWKPTGVTAAIVLYESPVWLTKEFRVREQDADNKVKPTLDAAAIATKVPDELHWQFHVFKVSSRRTRTIVYLFDLGEVVDYYGG